MDLDDKGLIEYLEKGKVMWKCFHKMYIGSLLIVLDIRVFLDIDVLPDLFGYILIAAAMLDLYKLTRKKTFLIPLVLHSVLIPLHAIDWIADVKLENLTSYDAVCVIASSLFIAIAYLYLVKGLNPYIEDLEVKSDLRRFAMLFIAFYLSKAALISFYHFSDTPTYTILLTIIFALELVVLVGYVLLFKKLRNYFDGLSYLVDEV